MTKPSVLGKTAILGGSFDPPTVAHLQTASETINVLGFDSVWLVPCGERTDKRNFTTPQQRFEMAQLAIADFYPNDFPVRVNPIEVENGAALQTANLMDRLNESYGRENSFHFLMGSDLIESMHEWQDGDRMIKEMATVIFLRKGYDNAMILSHKNFPQNATVVVGEDESCVGDISSTMIRRRIGQRC